MEFFYEIKLHRELTDLPFQRGDGSFVLGQHRRFDFFTDQLAAVELRQPELYEIGRQAVLLCASRRPIPPDRISWQSCSLNCGACRR